MDYEAIDRDMSSWVCAGNDEFGYRCWIDADDQSVTYRLSFAKRFRWWSNAEAMACYQAEKIPWNHPMHWRGVTVAGEMAAGH